MNALKKDEYWLDTYKGVIFKVLSLILTVYNIRLMVSYLGHSIYGDWVTISSIVSWMNVGDFGIGNGLRNEISKLYAHNDKNRIKNTIYSTNKLFIIIAVLMFLVIIVIGKLLVLLNVVSEDYFLPLMLMSFFFALGLFLGRVQSVALGIQKTWYTYMSNLIGISISILCYKIVDVFGLKPSLIVCSLFYGISTIIPLLIVAILLMHILNSDTDFVYVYEKKLVGNIFNSGFRFFILQLTSLILFSTDNILVKYYFGSSEVTKYSLINQIYNTGSSIFFILINSFWSGVTIHYEKKEVQWISFNVKRLLIVLQMFLIGIIFVSLFLNRLIQLWLGEKDIVYSFSIILIFAIYCYFDCLQSIFSNLNYGIGNTNLIMKFGIFSSIINIPLSILFAKLLHMGISGIKLGTFVSLIPSWVCIIIITYGIIKKMNYQQTRT